MSEPAPAPAPAAPPRPPFEPRPPKPHFDHPKPPHFEPKPHFDKPKPPAAAPSGADKGPGAFRRFMDTFLKHSWSREFLFLLLADVLPYWIYRDVLLPSGGLTQADTAMAGAGEMDGFLLLLMASTLVVFLAGPNALSWICIVAAWATMIAAAYVLEAPELSGEGDTVGANGLIGAMGTLGGIGLFTVASKLLFWDRESRAIAFARPSSVGGRDGWFWFWLLRVVTGAVTVGAAVTTDVRFVNRRWPWGMFAFLVFSMPGSWLNDLLAGVSWGVALQDLAAWGVV